MDNFSDHGADLVASRVGRHVRRERELQELTASELAERSGLSRTIVTTIERGEGNPSLGTLWRLSRTLRVPIGALIGEETPPLARVVRAEQGETIADVSGMVARLVHAEGRERRSEVFSITLPVGARRDSAPHFRGVEELLFVISGSLTAGPDEASATLGPGDAVWFAADGPHHYEALGRDDCAFVCWMFYPAVSR